MRKLFAVYALGITLTLASCGLLLGPLSEISLSQRLNKGWTNILTFSFQNLSYVTNSSFYKIRLGRYKDEIRGYYAFFNAAIEQLYYFTTNNYSNYITGNSTVLSNMFDMSTENTNAGIIYRASGGTDLGMHKGSQTNLWLSASTSLDLTYRNVLLTESNTTIGFSSGGTNHLITIQFGSSTSNIFASISTNYTNIVLRKCRNIISNSTIVYCTFNELSNVNNNYLQAFYATGSRAGTALLNSPMPIASRDILMEIDKSSRIFLLNGNGIYRYNSTGKTFDKDLDAPVTTLVDSYGITTAAFIGDDLVILYSGASSTGKTLMLYSYNTTTRSFNGMAFPTATNGINPALILGADIFYEEYSYRTYVGILELFPNGSSTNLNGYLFLNQM